MPRVRFADDFFRKERDQAYADWRLSVWRELFQNAIDQDASEIRIGLTAADGCVKLHFSDNGPGMTRQVLEDVYFAIGATTKSGPDQIGGMGRARVLTCFSMQSYMLRSQDYLVTGQGGDYDVTEMPFTRGCTLDIDVDDATLEQLQEKLLTFLGESRITANVILNGERRIERAPLNGRFVRDLTRRGTSFAKVYVNKSAPQRLIVRVNGVSMYTKRIAAKAQVVVELDAAQSRTVLTSNRDGMHWQYDMVLDDFLTSLAVDTQTALRPRFTRHTITVRGGGMNKVQKPVERKPTPSVITPTLIVEETPEPVFDVPTRADTYNETMLPIDTFGAWLKRTFGDLYVFDETENAEMHKAVSAYLPENWRTKTINGRTSRKGGNILRVLLMWKTAIAYALEVALEPLGKTDVEYAVGFIFADDCLAQHNSRDGGHVFTLRPVNKTGKLDYSVTARASLLRLMAYAKHEVTHIAESYHDEDFSRMREAIDCRFDQAECLRRMKLALKNVPDFDSDEIAWGRAA